MLEFLFSWRSLGSYSLMEGDGGLGEVFVVVVMIVVDVSTDLDCGVLAYMGELAHGDRMDTGELAIGDRARGERPWGDRVRGDRGERGGRSTGDKGERSKKGRAGLVLLALVLLLLLLRDTLSSLSGEIVRLVYNKK